MSSTLFAQDGPCGRPYDVEVGNPYAIDGVWMDYQVDACEWQVHLERFHNIGGTKVLQFGTELFEASRDDFWDDREDFELDTVQFEFLTDC